MDWWGQVSIFWVKWSNKLKKKEYKNVAVFLAWVNEVSGHDWYHKSC